MHSKSLFKNYSDFEEGVDFAYWMSSIVKGLCSAYKAFFCFINDNTYIKSYEYLFLLVKTEARWNHTRKCFIYPVSGFVSYAER